MARPRKEGLDYFPMDVNLDEKWESIEALHNGGGCWVCLKIMQECYKKASGEVDYSDVIRRKTLAKRVDCDGETLDSIIATAVHVGLFDKTAFDDRQVLTSNGIKKRIDAVSEDRRGARIRAEAKPAADKNPAASSWRKDFEQYKKMVIEKTRTVLSDAEWMQDKSTLYPHLDIKMTIIKSCKDFWLTEDGWKNKKQKRGTPDWRKTYRNAITQRFNWVNAGTHFFDGLENYAEL